MKVTMNRFIVLCAVLSLFLSGCGDGAPVDDGLGQYSFLSGLKEVQFDLVVSVGEGSEALSAQLRDIVTSKLHNAGLKINPDADIRLRLSAIWGNFGQKHGLMILDIRPVNGVSIDCWTEDSRERSDFIAKVPQFASSNMDVFLEHWRKVQKIRWSKLCNEATQLYEKKKFDSALQIAKVALDSAEVAFGPDHPQVAVGLANLAFFEEHQGQHYQAEWHYKRALSISEKAFGPDDPQVATILENMASVYQATHQKEMADEIMKRAVRIRAIKR